MLDLPIPKSRHAWLAAIILTFITFWLYYYGAYPILFKFYRQQLYTNYGSDELSTPAYKDLVVKIYVPQELCMFVQRWFFIQVVNTGAVEVKDVKVEVILDPEDTTPIFLPTMFSDQVVERALFFEDIQPHATISGRIPVLIGEDKPRRVTIRLNGEEVNFSVVIPPLQVSPKRAVIHSLVENLLLPPWANGLILFAVLISCYLVSKPRDEAEPAAENHLYFGEPPLFSWRGLKGVLQVLFSGAGLLVSEVGVLIWSIWDKKTEGFFLVIVGLSIAWFFTREIPDRLKKTGRKAFEDRFEPAIRTYIHSRNRF